MEFNFISEKYPANDPTDGNKLYASLGSFWTQIFQERGTLKGYTLGMAEELIQSYYSLVEILNSYSIRDIPVFNLKKWQPLTIRRSEFNSVPLAFQKNSAVFGMQPESDRFYSGKVFRFGFPKNTNDNVFSHKPKLPLKKFNVIANRIIDPSFFYINGVDVIVDDYGVFYFNKNIFDDPRVPKAALVGENGLPALFKASDGTLVEDEFIILWVYHAEVDTSNIYNNFGCLFELNLPSSEGYKQILQGLINLFVGGPTISGIKAIMAAFNGVRPVVEPVERVERVYGDNLNKYVITDKNVYSFKPYQNILKDVVPGALVHGGDILIDLVQYYDNSTTPGWWEKVITTPKLALSSHIFLGNYKHQLFLPSGVNVVSLTTQNTIVFPITGRPEDVKEFHKHINSPQSKEELKRKLGLSSETPVVVISPLSFVFENILKNNTALLKFNFNSPEELACFFELLPLVKDYLPPHVYILFYINLNIPVEALDNLNHRYRLTKFLNVPLSIDGSTGDGMRPTLPGGDPNYYKEYIERLFCISEGPYAEDAAHGGIVSGSGVMVPRSPNAEPLHKEQNLLKVVMASSGSGLPVAGQARVAAGKVFTSIPTQPTPTNREIPTVLLIDFS